ncbi:MAG: IS1182 family transposase [Candidatus Obscuribacterales bacterium]|nr:IS1182 family transposase [Candidatus Obscuribacterales bacterium]
MSLGSDQFGSVPEDTATVVKAIFGRKKNKKATKNAYIVFADHFPIIFTQIDFEKLYSQLGQHGACPVRLALLTLVQFAEGMSDEDAMEALISRIDLKYLLRLPLGHEGFDPSILTEFRARLIKGSAEELLMDRILQLAEDDGLLKKSKQRTDSTHVLSAARSMTRVELILEAMRHCLDVLSDIVPEFVLNVSTKFLMAQAYELRGLAFRIPKKENQRKELAEKLGKDAVLVLSRIDGDESLGFLKKVPAVLTLRRVFAEQFEDSGKGGPKFRKVEDLANSKYLIGSPHDTEARYSTKREDTWLGYAVHITETCEEGGPRLITDVQATRATTSDSETLPVIQRSLRKRGLSPAEQFVDAGYTKAESMKASAEKYSIKVIGPLRGGNTWQSQENKGFDISKFSIDWDSKKVTCPTGVQSQSWRERKGRNSIEVIFAGSNCQKCPFKEQCTKSEVGGRRLEFKPKELFEFLQKHRIYENSEEFKKAYRQRAGVEGAISQAVRTCEMRRARYVGLKKVSLQAKLTGAAINFLRTAAYLVKATVSKTRESRYARLRHLGVAA